MTREPRDYAPEDWFQALSEEVGATLTETTFNASESLIRGKHDIGREIANASAAQGVPELELCREVARQLKVSSRTIEQAAQFYRFDPKCDVLNEGKNISWRKVLLRMQGKRPPKAPCPHQKFSTITVCDDCGDKL